MHKKHVWNVEKNNLLINNRGISFEEICEKIFKAEFLSIIENPKQNEYPNQKIYVFNINNYIYLVPFVEDDEKIFLKTIYPSRAATKFFLGKDKKS